MTFTEALVDRIVEPTRRRTVRLIQPRAQLKLAAYLLLLSVAFISLEVFNSWSAYARIAEPTLSFGPAGLRQDVLDQTQAYLHTSLALLAGFVFCVVVLSVGYMHQVLGPIVAFERYLRTLRNGDYDKRIALRGNDHLYAELANQLNQLAAQLQESNRSRARQHEIE
jgi:nitrogen fixation/metabolism regulation signal transduction histidine kinase